MLYRQLQRIVCALAPGLAMAVILALAGCGAGTRLMPWSGATGGSLRVESLGDERVVLPGRFESAVYADRGIETSFLICDRPISEFLQGGVESGRVIHVELLWSPKAGATPIEDSATNASIRYIIFSAGEVGIYAGAGFARLKGTPGDEVFGLAIQDASLKLIDSTPGFNDLLTPARLTGSFGARLDNHQTTQLHRAVSQRVTNQLGRSRIVLNTWNRATASGG